MIGYTTRHRCDHCFGTFVCHTQFDCSWPDDNTCGDCRRILSEIEEKGVCTDGN